jgi:protein O-mannosyl-transferase
MGKGRKHSRRAAPRSRSAIYWGVVVGLAAVAVYLNALGNEFVVDDIRLIRDNLRIRSLSNLPHLFSSPYWEIEGPQALYRPLVLATYAGNYAVNGLSTLGYTAVNMVLHGAVSVLVFALARSIGGSPAAAAVTGLAFAVHPVHTEAVTGISGRPELLTAFFFLIAMHFHRLAPGAGKRAIWYRLGVLVAFVGALLSKESAMTLLLVLPFMDVLVPAKAGDGQPTKVSARLVTDYLPLIAVAVAYLAVRRAVLGGITIPEGVIAPLDNPLVAATTSPLGDRVGATPGQGLMTSIAVIAEYARLLISPARLSPDYSYNQIPLVTTALDGRFITGLALTVAGIGGVAVLWRRSPVAAFGLAFLALTFSIVSNLAVKIGTICAERLIYLPSAGFLIAAAIGVERLAASGTARRRLVYGSIAVLVVVAGLRTWGRNRDWKDERTLWTTALEAAPNSARVQSENGRLMMGLAENAAASGRAAEAERLFTSAQRHFETSLKIYPSYSLALDGLAMIHSMHERYDDAAVLYERALKAWPGNFASLTNWGASIAEQSKRLASKAVALRGEGKVADSDALAREADAGFRRALDKIDRAIAMMPSYAHAHLVRALILDPYLGDRQGARLAFEEVLRLMPNHPQRKAIENELER